MSDANQCIAWDATDASAYELRAWIYLDRGKVQLAEKDIATAKALSPGDSRIAELQAGAAKLGNSKQ